MISQAVLQCLDTQARKFPNLQQSVDLITQTYKEKLWHQLTEALFTYTNEKAFDEGQNLIELHTCLIKDLTMRVNPLNQAQITITVSRQFTDLEQAIEFLDAARQRLAGNIGKAEKKLQLGQHHDCFEILIQVKKELEALSDVDPIVYANLMLCITEERMIMKISTRAVFNTLHILQLQSSLKARRKTGRLRWLDKEILHSLVGSDFEWLHELLNTLGRGQIQEFGNAINKHAEYISRFKKMKEALASKEFLEIAIFTIILLINHFNKSNKIDQFVNDVELLVMKAMSLELIKGQIDEVDEVVHVNWILPRYLSKSHLEIMVRKIGQWEVKMDEIFKQVEGQSEELLLH